MALRKDEKQPVVTEEAKARAEQAAADLLAELGADMSPSKSGAWPQKRRKDEKKKKGNKNRHQLK